MKILVTGANGRLGGHLVTLLKAHDHVVTGIDIDTVDITKRDDVNRVFGAARPDVVLHCAALTAVDYCAQHPNDALEVNAFGTQNIALACCEHHAALLYVSTNEVFDGRASREYLEYDRPAPPNPYGYSKWVGEQIVRDLVKRHYVVRTSWLFAHGGGNFMQAILERAARGESLRVVTNEVSTPTYANDLAQGIMDLIATGQYGIYHVVNGGHASRYEFARHTLDLAGFKDTPIEPIALAEYPRASRPPEYSALRNLAAARLGIVLRPWRDAVTEFLRAEGLLRE